MILDRDMLGEMNGSLRACISLRRIQTFLVVLPKGMVLDQIAADGTTNVVYDSLATTLAHDVQQNDRMHYQDESMAGRPQNLVAAALEKG